MRRAPFNTEVGAKPERFAHGRPGDGLTVVREEVVHLRSSQGVEGGACGGRHLEAGGERVVRHVGVKFDGAVRRDDAPVDVGCWGSRGDMPGKRLDIALHRLDIGLHRLHIALHRLDIALYLLQDLRGEGGRMDGWEESGWNREVVGRNSPASQSTLTRGQDRRHRDERISKGSKLLLCLLLGSHASQGGNSLSGSLCRPRAVLG